MPNCAVDNVFAPNGEPSQLWEDIQSVSRTQDEALRLYLNVKNEPIPEEDLDANGEAQIEAVLDRDDLGFRPRHRASRLHRSTHTPTGTSNEIGKEIGMDAVAEQLDRAIERLRLEGSTLDEGSAEKQRINEQINQLQDQKASLEEDKSIQSIRSVAQNHRQMIEEVLRMPNVSQQQLNFVSMLVDAWDYDRTTKYYLSKAQRQSEDPLNQALQDINDKFEDLQSEVDSMVEDVVMDNIREYWGDSISREEALNPPDGNFAENLSNIFFDMTRFDSPLAQRFANTLRMNVIKKNRWIRDHKADIQESLDQVDDLTRLLAENEEGEKVVSLINPYNVEYYARRQATLEDFQQATEEITSKPAMIQAKRNFLEQLSKTDEVVDIRYLVEDLEDDGEFDSPEAYREYLRERHGEKTGDELADDALNGWQNYQDHLMGKKEALETDLSTGSLTEQEYREDLQRFKRVNSPLIATREFKDGDVREAYNKGHRYVTYAGKPEFQDDKYHGRTEDGLTKTEREAADKLRQLYAKMMDYLPTQKVRDTQENFLPVVKKEWEEILTDEGVRAMGEEMKNEFFSDFMSDEEAGLFDDDQFPDAFSGLTDNKSIPIRHLNDAAVSDKFQSEDVQKMTDQFIAMVGRYHFMKKARPKIELMGRIVEEVTGDSNKGLTLDDMSGDAVFESSMRHTVNALMFEQHREDEYNDDSFIVEGGIGSNIEAKKKRRNIKKRHKKLYKRYEDGEITKETYENQAKKLDEKMKELGGKKWSFTRFVESTLGQYTMLKGLGWAPLSGLNNVLFGMMANSVEAASGEYFTDESYTRAIQTYWRLWKEGSEKIPNLMQTFNIFFEVAELAYGKKAKKDKESFMKRALKDPMILMNEGETFIQGIAMVAYMMEQKVQVNENGEQKEVSLWEAFNEQGRWDEERFGYNEEFQGTKEEQQEIDRHALRVVQVIKRIHGNFDTSSPLWLKSTAIGRMLSMFKTWMFEGFAYRFGSKQYDEALGKYVKGSYRSAWDQWIESDSTADFFQDAVALARANDVEAKAEELGIADYDAYSIKRALREMRWWARTMMAMVVLKTLTEGIDEEEDSPAQATGMAVYNTLFRLNQDTTFYLNPATAVETAKNPVPAMQTLGDFIRAFESTKSYLTDPDYQGNPASQIGKNVPGVSSAYSMYYIANNDLSNVR